MKIIALDPGDVHTGIAVADDLKLLARPYTTVLTVKLEEWLTDLCMKEPLETIVLGYPQTLRGTESAQTKKVLLLKENLEKKIPQVQWILWDERLTSKQAQQLHSKKIKKDKTKEHAIAAALILQSFLESLRYKD